MEFIISRIYKNEYGMIEAELINTSDIDKRPVIVFLIDNEWLVQRIYPITHPIVNELNRIKGALL